MCFLSYTLDANLIRIFEFACYFILVSKQSCLPFFQILMSALPETITAMLRQSVLTQMGVLLALVMQDTLVLALVVKVNVS